MSDSEGLVWKADSFVPTFDELRILAREYLTEWYRYEIDHIVTGFWSMSDTDYMAHCWDRINLLAGALGPTEVTSALAPVHEYYRARLFEIEHEVRLEREAELRNARADGKDDWPF